MLPAGETESVFTSTQFEFWNLIVGSKKVDNDRMKTMKPQSRIFPIVLAVSTFFFLFTFLSAQEKQKEQEKKIKTITEEIVVEAEVPRDLPISFVSTFKNEKIEAILPRDLSEVLSYTTGTFVSAGSKNESRIKIRGLESQRITLLYDGIPVYEPFFNSFDLKTFPAGEVDTIKVVKGASSVLYGPNSLGGVINIITKRPETPSFSLETHLDSHSAFYLSSTGAVKWDRFYLSGTAFFDRADGFEWNSSGGNVQRENSDYSRKNISGKVYFYPNSKSEILMEASYYWAEYGVPFALEYYKSRYWRFDSWNRFQFNLGGMFFFSERGSLKFRSYYVKHANVLDSYADNDFAGLSWRSSYKNDSFGAFLLGDYSLYSQNELKFSLNYRQDRVRTQDDTGQDWEEFRQQTSSLGLEDHINLDRKWKLVGGLSLDYLDKHAGGHKVSFNPIGGIKFSPSDYLDLHATISRKSRFPSMRAMYSTQAGNPDLRDERGRSYELGLSYDNKFRFAAAVFLNRIRDLIETVRLSEGFRTNINIGKANILGFEMEIQKAFKRSNFSINYTYLDGENLEEKRPLDLSPESQLNAVMEIRSRHDLQVTLWGLAVSGSQVKIDEDIVKIPGYVIVNAIFSKSFSKFMIFLKAENLFNKYYVTEPGYPMKARTLSLGLKLKLNDL
jgi:iron complex outermembrane receptor protein